MSKSYFAQKTCFQSLILQKKHIYQLICAVIIGGELVHYKEEEEDWEDEEEEEEEKDDYWRYEKW